MGKVRTRIIGLEEVEEKQKKEQKERAKEKALKGKSKEPSIDKELGKSIETATPKPKSKKVVARDRGKNYQNAKKSIDQNKTYSLDEAIKALKKIKYAKFDESVELHINVNEAGLKGEVKLPHATGKTLRVKIADDKTLADLEKGTVNFDILVSHPTFMPRLAKYARVLGPKGLMPSPKSGTISEKPEEVVKKFAAGGFRWKTEPKSPLIHLMVGKISAPEKNLEENIKLLLKSIGGNNIQAAFVKTTMSPSIKLDIDQL